MPVARPRSVARLVLLASAAAILTAPAFGQETIIIGGSARPSVEVNLDVLDDPLGGRFPGLDANAPIRLRPPGSAAPRSRTPPRSTSASPPRNSRTTTTAARSTPTPPPL